MELNFVFVHNTLQDDDKFQEKSVEQISADILDKPSLT